ncbi:MAG: tRNA uridine-5-carboxymethylaminomethyl(34) synthesis GTPase MnmE, partial [Anaerovoracaceae bacterium]
MKDTIAAISTAYGEGGIGVVRISGDLASEILGKIFISSENSAFLDKIENNKKSEKKEFSEIKSNSENVNTDKQNAKKIAPRELKYGYIYDKNASTVIDEVLAVFFPAPKTYTKEDIVEIQCHGSIVAPRKILELALREGARLAEPGEFTKIAFLNGRLDLSQAEAVIDLIKAKTDISYDSALAQLEGNFSKDIRIIRESLLEILAKIIVALDYPEEGAFEDEWDESNSETKLAEEIGKKINEANKKIEELINSADTGRILREGLKIAIVGEPNVGKSSILNALLKESRSIVTDIPGTTRDLVEENLSIRGIPIVITDTAGIRESEDIIEQAGIERSKSAINEADLVLHILEAKKIIAIAKVQKNEISEDINEMADSSAASRNNKKVDLALSIVNKENELSELLKSRPIITIINKIDLLPESEKKKRICNNSNAVVITRDKVSNVDYNEDIESNNSAEKQEKIGIPVSVKERINLDLIEGAIENFVFSEERKNKVVSNNYVNMRQKQLLIIAKESLNQALNSIDANMSLDLVEVDIKDAFENLGEIIGESYSEEILDQVFS